METYPKVFLENLFQTFFGKYDKVWFLGLWKFPMKYKIFSKLGARKLHFLKYKKLFKTGFFLLFELGKFLPEISEFFLGFLFPEI